MAKMTYSDALNFVLTNYEIPEDVAERLTAAKTTLDKRAANAKQKERKLSPSEQKEREAIMAFRNTVLKFMEESPNTRLWSCSELADKFGVTIPKISAAMKYWIGEKRVVRDCGSNGRLITYQIVKGE